MSRDKGELDGGEGVVRGGEGGVVVDLTLRGRSGGEGEKGLVGGGQAG